MPPEGLEYLENEYNFGATEFWTLYGSEAEQHDKNTTETWKADMDSTLIFAGLFSATVTAFIIESYKLLKQDSGDVTNALLTQILTAQTTLNVSAEPLLISPTPFTPLTAALCVTLVQEWVRDYLQRIQRQNQPLRRARVRAFLFNGMDKWKMDEVVEYVPTFLHASLFLFFAGLLPLLCDSADGSDKDDPSMGKAVCAQALHKFRYTRTRSASYHTIDLSMAKQADRAIQDLNIMRQTLENVLADVALFPGDLTAELKILLQLYFGVLRRKSLDLSTWMHRMHNTLVDSSMQDEPILRWTQYLPPRASRLQVVYHDIPSSDIENLTLDLYALQLVASLRGVKAYPPTSELLPSLSSTGAWFSFFKEHIPTQWRKEREYFDRELQPIASLLDLLVKDPGECDVEIRKGSYEKHLPAMKEGASRILESFWTCKSGTIDPQILKMTLRAIRFDVDRQLPDVVRGMSEGSQVLFVYAIHEVIGMERRATPAKPCLFPENSVTRLLSLMERAISCTASLQAAEYMFGVSAEQDLPLEALNGTLRDEDSRRIQYVCDHIRAERASEMSRAQDEMS
ncbi:hypothetical protein DXG01_015292 [Tephrocybe rancida]|nr:hypothetical protein DXG01_015292 [Tephrocybe rancida]